MSKIFKLRILIRDGDHEYYHDEFVEADELEQAQAYFPTIIREDFEDDAEPATDGRKDVMEAFSREFKLDTVEEARDVCIFVRQIDGSNSKAKWLRWPTY